MNVIQVEQVTRSFGRVKALDGLNLSVRQGEVYGLLGRNGAGKTTTLRILMGILEADGGTLEILGQRVTRVDTALKRRIGYVSQEQTFYPWMTAVELGRFVGALYPTWDPAEYERLLKLLDVEPKRRSGQLSGGTRTKLALALALASRPPLLLLDEPTAGLDPVARREFGDVVQRMVQERGITAFFSSHLVDEVQRLAQRVGILQAGRVEYEGEVDRLLAEVRRVVLPEPGPVPAGFTQIRGAVWRAEAGTWDNTLWPEGTQVHSLSLEEVFLAFARTDPGVPSA